MVRFPQVKVLRKSATVVLGLREPGGVVTVFRTSQPREVRHGHPPQ
jgi:hypothetical protein